MLDAAARDAQLERAVLHALMVDRIVRRCRRHQGGEPKADEGQHGHHEEWARG